MNALTYAKNVGKSFGYASIDIFKEALPSVTSMVESAKDFSSDLYQSIKDFQSKAYYSYRVTHMSNIHLYDK